MFDTFINTLHERSKPSQPPFCGGHLNDVRLTDLKRDCGYTKTLDTPDYHCSYCGRYWYWRKGKIQGRADNLSDQKWLEQQGSSSSLRGTKMTKAEIKLIEKWKDKGGSQWVSPDGSPLANSGWKEVIIEKIGYGHRPATSPAELHIWIRSRSTGEIQCLLAKRFEKFFKPAPFFPSSTSRPEVNPNEAVPV